MTTGAPPRLDKAAETPSADVTATLRQIKSDLAAQRGMAPDEPTDACHTGGRYDWDLNDKTERRWCTDWLLQVIKWATRRHETTENDEWEEIMDQAGLLLSELSGKNTSGPVQRRVSLWLSKGEKLPGGIHIHEPSMMQADVGGQTWGSAILLARRIMRRQINIESYKNCIELGSGTGLLGLAVGKVLQAFGATVAMTDYLPVLLHAIEKSARSNGLLKDGTVVPMHLDWFEMVADIITNKGAGAFTRETTVSVPVAHYMSVDERQLAGCPEWHGRDSIDFTQSKSRFDLIIAADVLYEIEQCRAIPLLVDHFLSNAPSGPAGSMPRFIVTTPLRSMRRAEITEFEGEMAKIPSLHLVSADDVSRADDMIAWRSAVCENVGSDLLGYDHGFLKAFEEDLGDSNEYRTYIFERRK
ncbi:hypothetical protein BX661DRAFT_184385 [Kickxella alabastrina]|uniref:uncharacterized protein n=1 Tax=Kickxella alabastrina TaxID=61397 RepID=UPI00221F57A6|nr:uncharacterized protein BX661DRAFT_184385 [Kickxella alabastrina]KAI7825911.1 hypothetical protein BX661DRAFT_184385 [Kickxella alabastrina]KAJ1947238.1 hypothetical protein GGF37_000540 [Kickxella alabastrina]